MRMMRIPRHAALVLALTAAIAAAANFGCTYRKDKDPKPKPVWSPLPPGAEDYTGPDHVALVEYTSALG